MTAADTPGRTTTTAAAAEAEGPRDGVVQGLAGYRLKRSYLVVRNAAHQVLEPLGLRVVSMTALSLVVDNPGIAPSQIADALQMERSNIVVIIDELETRHLINRERSASDRRRFALTATVKGRRLRDTAVEAVAEAEDRALSALSAEEKAQFIALLGKVTSGRREGGPAQRPQHIGPERIGPWDLEGERFRMKISDQIALVTGGGSGLGAATARRLAAQGARVAVLDRGMDAAQAVAADIGGLALEADVSDPAAVEAAFARAQESLGGPPRIVVSCAGIGSASRILPREGDLPFEMFERVIRVNLIGTYTVMSVGARAMAAAEPLDDDGARGVVVNTASIAYQDGQIGQAAYAASKGGVVSMALPAARELARFGIRVMTIAPGLFDTAMGAGLPAEIKASLEAGLPFPSRMGQADEFAMLVQQIVENPVLNGEVIRIDSAVRMAPK